MVFSNICNTRNTLVVLLVLCGQSSYAMLRREVTAGHEHVAPLKGAVSSAPEDRTGCPVPELTSHVSPAMSASHPVGSFSSTSLLSGGRGLSCSPITSPVCEGRRVSRSSQSSSGHSSVDSKEDDGAERRRGVVVDFSPPPKLLLSGVLPASSAASAAVEDGEDSSDDVVAVVRGRGGPSLMDEVDTRLLGVSGLPSPMVYGSLGLERSSVALKSSVLAREGGASGVGVTLEGLADDEADDVVVSRGMASQTTPTRRGGTFSGVRRGSRGGRSPSGWFRAGSCSSLAAMVGVDGEVAAPTRPDIFPVLYVDHKNPNELYRDSVAFVVKGIFSGSVNLNVQLPQTKDVSDRFRGMGPGDVAKVSQELVSEGIGKCHSGVYIRTQATCALNPTLKVAAFKGALSDWEDVPAVLTSHMDTVMRIAQYLGARIALGPVPSINFGQACWKKFTARCWVNSGEWKTQETPHKNYAWDFSLEGYTLLGFRVLLRDFIKDLTLNVARSKGHPDRTLAELFEDPKIKGSPVMFYTYLEGQLQVFVRHALLKCWGRRDVVSDAAAVAVDCLGEEPVDEFEAYYRRLSEACLRHGGNVEKNLLIDLYTYSGRADASINSRAASTVNMMVQAARGGLVDSDGEGDE